MPSLHDQPAIFAVDAFRTVQNESTEKLSQHLAQLQRAMSESNELHREQLNILRQLRLQPLAGKEQESGRKVDSDTSIDCKDLSVVAGTHPTLDLSVGHRPTTSSGHKAGNLARVSSMVIKQMESIKHLPEKMHQKKKKRSKANRSDTAKHLDEELPLEIRCGQHITWGKGYGGFHKVLDYDLDRLTAYAALPLIFSSAAIFRLRSSVTIQLTGQVALMISIAFVVHLARDGEPLVDKQFHSSSYGKSLKFINDALQRLVPFVLAFFITMQMKRWWTIRSSYLQRIHTSTMQISLQLGLVLPETTERFRTRIERYLLASHKLIYVCARQAHLTRLDYDGLIAAGVMTQAEVDHVRASIAAAPPKLQMEIGACDMAVAGIPVTWAAQLIYRIFISSKEIRPEIRFDFPVNLMVQMLSQCVSIKKDIQNIEMMLTSPLPFPYVHLVALVVHALAIFSCIEAGIFLGCSEVNVYHFVAHCFGVLILNGLYLSILCIAVLLTNPFTEECVDFPASNFHCRMRKMQIFSRHVCYKDKNVDEEICKELGKGDDPNAPAKPLTAKKENKDEEIESDDADADDDDDDDDHDETMNLDFF